MRSERSSCRRASASALAATAALSAPAARASAAAAAAAAARALSRAARRSARSTRGSADASTRVAAGRAELAALKREEALGPPWTGAEPPCLGEDLASLRPSVERSCLLSGAAQSCLLPRFDCTLPLRLAAACSLPGADSKDSSSLGTSAAHKSAARGDKGAAGALAVVVAVLATAALAMSRAPQELAEAACQAAAGAQNTSLHPASQQGLLGGSSGDRPTSARDVCEARRGHTAQRQPEASSHGPRSAGDTAPEAEVRASRGVASVAAAAANALSGMPGASPRTRGVRSMRGEDLASLEALRRP